MGTTEQNTPGLTAADSGCVRVDLAALAANYRDLRTRVAPALCGAVVKADAYGLGLERVATCLQHQGCERFFVATIREGAELRRLLADAAVSVFVFNGIVPGCEPTVHAHRLTPVLNSIDQIAIWSAYARRIGQTLPAIINIDTGMLRLGLSHRDVDELRRQPDRLSGLALDYVMTHLACADDRMHPGNRAQIALFDELRTWLPVAKTSIANSAGICLGRDFHGDLVRPGIALYGGKPMLDACSAGIREVVQLKACVLQIRVVDAPGSVGYGGTYSVQAPARLATVGVGYADGYPRSLSNRGIGVIAGRRYPVVGRVSMDLCTLDVSAAPTGSIRVGEEVNLVGGGIELDEVAANAGTVGYEILTGLGKRLRREYLL